ncbi:hypothetical protein ACFLRZ_03150 [Bacteroidota bacterium]
MKKSVIISGFIMLPIFFLILGSCGTKVDKSEQLAKIDSLKMIIDQMELKLDEINMDEVNKKFLEYQLNMKEIVAHIEKEMDTVSGKYLMAYTKVKGPIKSFIKYHPSLKKDISKARKQLEDLYHDMENNLVDMKKFEEFVKTESDSIRYMNNWISEYVVKVKEQLVNFDSVNPKVKEIIKFHKKK